MSDRDLWKVVSDPGIRGGIPVMGGTRIPAHIIVGLIGDGLSGKEVRGLYPSITRGHIKAAHEWADRAHCEGHGGTGGVWYCCEHPDSGWPCDKKDAS